MKKHLTLIIISSIILFHNSTYTQETHHIEFELENYSDKEMILTYYFGNKRYISDTLKAIQPGKFESKGKSELSPGMYTAYFPRIDASFDFLINKGEQHFKLTTNLNSLITSMQVQNSPENRQFFEYLNFLSEKRANLSKMTKEVKELKKLETNKIKINKLENEIQKINDKVVAYQKDIITKNPKSFTARIIKINSPINIPEKIRNNNNKAYYYYKEHFFDNVYFNDERFLRSPMLHQKIEQYISSKVSVQHPDSITVAVDRILNLSKGNDKIYHFVLSKLLNKYAKSKIVCMDAVYVHLVDNYYAQGKASWIEKEQLNKIQLNANELRPILCNSIAPEINIQTVTNRNKTKSLLKTTSKYIVLFMWNPDADFIPKVMQQMIKFYDEFKSKGVELFSICTKSKNLNKAELLEFIDNNGIDRWENLVDWDNRSNYKQDYRLLTNLSIFILDENKKIISKRIGVDQITNLMNNILKKENSVSE
ncbi:DUF5106 domain-containing protein [Polaribacter sp. R77954]|uniref:DUF5106 domain-containing protein n=1 Tax=Polaribacter sp. R77954 TaxID=3093870 RepID=UPI0037C8E21F